MDPKELGYEGADKTELIQDRVQRQVVMNVDSDVWPTDMVSAGRDHSFVCKYTMQTKYSSHQSQMVDSEIVSEMSDTTPH